VAKGQGIIVMHTHGFNDLLEQVEWQSFGIATEWELCLKNFEIKPSWV